MTPGMKGAIAIIDLLLIKTTISLHAGIAPMDVAWYLLCVVLGFGLRVAVLLKDDKYTTKTLMIHMMFTCSWVFVMVLFWRTYLNTTWLNQGGNSFEIYLFLNSLFSVYMVGQFEHFFKVGFRGWLNLFVGKLIAKEVKEEEK